MSGSLKSEGEMCSQAKEELKPESAGEGDYSVTEECAPHSPELWRSLRQKGSVGERVVRRDRNRRAIWRDRDREDPFLIGTTRPSPQGHRDSLDLMSQVSLPAPVLSPGCRDGEEGSMGQTELKGVVVRKQRDSGSCSFCKREKPLLVLFLIHGVNLSLFHSSAFGS